MIHEGLYQLSAGQEFNSEVTGSLFLRIQWIYCRTEYFKNALSRVEESLKTEIEKRNNFQQHLDKFQLPFKDLLAQDDFGLDSDVDIEKLEIQAR